MLVKLTKIIVLLLFSIELEVYFWLILNRK
jgi:hypothetical protein